MPAGLLHLANLFQANYILLKWVKMISKIHYSVTSEHIKNQKLSDVLGLKHLLVTKWNNYTSL